MRSWLPTMAFALAALNVAVLGAGNPLMVDVLYISRGLFQGSIIDKVIAADPSISVHAVPMPGHYSIGNLGKDPNAMARLMRMYMPRRYEDLFSETDIVILHEAPCGLTGYPQVYFDAKWMSWFVKAVQEERMSLAMWGGDASWGGGYEGWAFYHSWGETMLDKILPFESLEGTNPSIAGYQKPVFKDPNHPLARLPWQDAGPIELLNKVLPKDGATLVAEAVASDVRYPWIAWWRSGQGKVTGETQIFGSKGTTNKMLNEWQWYQDFLIYLTYFGADKPIPDDIYRAHRLREEINTHLAKVAMLVSLLEFVEKFGARTKDLYAEMDSINKLEKVGEELYRQDDYDGAASIFEQVHLAWGKLNGKAIAAKDRALIWVYTVEWCAVSGVGLLSGLFVWVAMVKRRFYRETRVTKLDRIE